VKWSGQRVSRGKPPHREVPLLSELRTVVEAIGAPVLIVGTHGQVLHANANGRTLFEANPRGMSQWFARSIAGASNVGGWELIPLSGHNGSRRFLAILNSVARGSSPVVSAPAGSTQAARARWKLTARQGQVLDLVARGLTNACIADSLAIGVGTVEFHVAKIFDKAGVDNRATLIARLHDL
jgi:DNA-binding CsgD family transcriptional regulator